MDAVDGLTDPILILYPDLSLYHVNAAAAALFRLPASSEEPVREQRASECLSALMAGRPCGGTSECPGCRLWRALRLCLARGETVGPVPFERTLVDRDGQPVRRSFEVMAHPFRTNGELGMLVTLQEVATPPDGFEVTLEAGRADA